MPSNTDATVPGDAVRPRGELHDEWRLSPDLHRAVAESARYAWRRVPGVHRRSSCLALYHARAGRSSPIISQILAQNWSFLAITSSPVPISIGWDGSTWHVDAHIGVDRAERTARSRLRLSLGYDTIQRPGAADICWMAGSYLILHSWRPGCRWMSARLDSARDRASSPASSFWRAVGSQRCGAAFTGASSARRRRLRAGDSAATRPEATWDSRSRRQWVRSLIGRRCWMRW